MTEVNTDSYPKATMPVSPLDTAQKLGGLQQQKLAIDQAKLNQANQGLTYMTRAMGALGPNASKEDYIKAAQTAVQMGLVPQEQLNVFVQRAQAAPSSEAFYNEFMTTAASHQEQLNYHLGQAGQSDNGQTVTPTVTSVKPGFGQRPTGLPVQQQAPPTTPTFGSDNQPRLLGAQPPQLAPGTAAIPTPLPRPTGLPVEPLKSGPTGPTVRRTDMEPTTFAQRFPQPQGPATGMAPMAEEGKKALMEDQANSTQKMTAIKPALLGLKLLSGLRTGPGTEAWNKGVAFLKANNVITTTQENDPTAIYQEANKYFSQYLKGRGGRSDADLAMAEKSSPNVGIQLNPALVKLTKSAIAQDMMEAARPTAFTKANRSDYQNYGEHRATFPQSVDQKAFEAAIASPEERGKLVDKMHAKYKKNPKDAEALKFFHSLDVAKQAGMLNAEED